ncbi:MAG: DUF3786 domain-containing protein [Lachnospiraceae bacterium]|nr:DUF3786 domain-containing protein [Lachnospiraceae bacterium]
MEAPGVSNYERLCEDWRKKFLGMDQEKLCKKLPELKKEGEYLTLLHFGRKFGVHRTTGKIAALADERPVSFTTQMDIYNLFWYSKETACIRNRWVPFRDVRDASPFAPAFERNVLVPFAQTFSGKTELLRKAAQSLDAEMVEHGDVGFILKCFACIPMQFLFWDADDEFPAQSNILFDYGVTDYIHVESTVTLATEGMLRLTEAAGIKQKGSVL